MTFQLVCIEPKELTQYKADMQEAFQKGFEDAFGKTDAVILPEKDRKSTRLNSSHPPESRMPSSA